MVSMGAGQFSDKYWQQLSVLKKKMLNYFEFESQPKGT